MVRLRNKAIIEMNEKDLYDRLKQIRADLFKLNVESKKGTLRKESGKLKPHRKNIARILTRINELKKK
ncbi:MAG: 50S ribosomal protein L29 [Candidatus Nitrosopelagicus sp.]|jgi:large subunit ribosomal protein L29|nr:50S ribosomal protein L29 [Candidatus Nitrosopelagicus sp.]|tara:strand:+ start:288 stop:491 length:204 start_codon:yes stop_codon:yes gene_type:complete